MSAGNGPAFQQWQFGVAFPFFFFGIPYYIIDRYKFNWFNIQSFFIINSTVIDENIIMHGWPGNVPSFSSATYQFSSCSLVNLAGSSLFLEGIVYEICLFVVASGNKWMTLSCMYKHIFLHLHRCFNHWLGTGLNGWMHPLRQLHGHILAFFMSYSWFSVSIYFGIASQPFSA